jgi:hypothetical protein
MMPRQALSIRHIVRGCLEGVFAQGQVYVLVSRVTCPWHFQLVGLPPKDLLEDVVVLAALQNATQTPFQNAPKRTTHNVKC